MGILGLPRAYAGPLCDPYAVIKWYVINDIKDSMQNGSLYLGRIVHIYGIIWENFQRNYIAFYMRTTGQ